MNLNINKDDFEYAFESTKIIREPDRFIDTFGITRFNFFMASELMDTVGQVRVREGVIEAHKPQIIKPVDYSSIEFDGFSNEAEGEAHKMLDWLKDNGHNLAFLQYGFSFKKVETKEELVHESIQAVLGKLKDEADAKNDPACAILEVVDDTWEVGLFKFTLQMIQTSKDVNVSDYRRSGLL